jgi:hypothetical protein
MFWLGIIAKCLLNREINQSQVLDAAIQKIEIINLPPLNI